MPACCLISPHQLDFGLKYRRHGTTLNWKAGQGTVYRQIFVVRKFRENVENHEDDGHFGDKTFVIAFGEMDNFSIR